MKRESVARRIVELAKDRQVVVFTHDVAFTMLLRKAADEIAVLYATRGMKSEGKQSRVIRLNIIPGLQKTQHNVSIS